MRWVFLATGGFLGRIDSETRCGFWADEPVEHGFDPARLIDVDLAATPSAAVLGRIGRDAVMVDDCYRTAGGELAGTTLGPRWPGISLVGAVYLATTYLATLPPALRPACPPDGLPGRAYEYQTALYWPHTDDPRAGRRYAGHHADILAEQGRLAYVAVYPPGRSEQPEARECPMWLDLSSPDQCDAGAGSLTTIGVGGAPKSGALFLPCGTVNTTSAKD